MTSSKATSSTSKTLAAFKPVKWVSTGLIACAALTLVGCSMPAAKADLERQPSQTERSARVTYGKNQQLASRACQDFSTSSARACTSAEPQAEQRMASTVLDPALLGFAPVDRREADEFSLEIARDEARKSVSPLSFGMLSGSFGQSWSYDLTLRRRTAETRSQHVATVAQPTDAGL